MTRLASIVACVVLLGCLTAPSGIAAERYQATKVVAFGDVHGAFDALTDLLKHTGVVDEQLRWQAGAAHLVSLGDLLDRGPDSRAVLDLLKRLQAEAAAAGGRVHVLLGNHELMNLTGDLRYVSAGERLAFAAPGATGDDAGLAELRAAYAPDGAYGQWLIEQPVAVVINDTAFVHGGLSPSLAGLDPETLDGTIRKHLRELLSVRDGLVADALLPAGLDVHDAVEQLSAVDSLTDDQRADAERFAKLVGDPLFGDEGPFWYRGNAWCHPLIETHNLTAVLEHWGVRRVVIGHTPTPDHRVHARLDGRVIMADTGMLTSHYGGRASAVVIEAGAVTVRYAGEPDAVAPIVDRGTPLDPLDESRIAAALRDAAPSLPPADGWQAVAVGGEQVAARFTRPAARARKSELAALRLDRLLGLNLVAPVMPMAFEGREALVTVSWPGLITEEQRAASAGAGPPPCSGSSVFALLYAFDALIGNQGRNAQTIIYEPRTRRLGSVEHGDSFGTSTRFPAYLERDAHGLPAPLAARLAELDETDLQTAVGDLLSGRQIRALLERRDRLLTEWAVEG